MKIIIGVVGAVVVVAVIVGVAFVVVRRRNRWNFLINASF